MDNYPDFDYKEMRWSDPVGVYAVNGYNIYTSPYLTEAGEQIERNLNWKERLFSWPWKPWVKTETYIPMVPMKSAIVDEVNRAIYVHPEIYQMLKTQCSGQIVDYPTIPPMDNNSGCEAIRFKPGEKYDVQ